MAKITDEVEEFDEDVLEESNDIEELSDMEEDETEGGAYQSVARQLGTVTKTTRASSVNLPEILLNVGVVNKVTWDSNTIHAKATWGAGLFIVSRKSSLGTARFKVYKKNGSWVQCNVTFK